MFHRPSSTSLASAVIVLLMLLMALGLSGCTPVTQPAPAEISSPDAPAPAETSSAAAMPTETSSAAAMPAETQPPAEASGAAAPPPPQGSVMPAGGPGGASTFASVDPSFIDLAYADQSEAQKLDLYLPTTGDGPFPVVMMVHGGGFMFGDKADGAGLTGVDQLLEAGYAVASINYRLSGEATWPAQIYDAKAAVRFLRANAAQYNLDPERFGAWGASAGGNLVAMLGTTCDVTELEGADLGGHRERRRIVDEHQVGLRRLGGRLQRIPVQDLALAQLEHRVAGDRRQDALGDLDVLHLQGEDGGGDALLGDPVGDVDCKGSLTRLGSCSQDDHI